MRIIGGHDYYDGVIPFDSDRERVFVRDRKEIELVPFDKSRLQVKSHQKRTIREIEKLEVIFCGKRYRGIHYIERTPIYQLLVDVHLWTKDRALKFMDFDDRPKWQWRRDIEQVFDEDLDNYFAPTPVDEKTFELLRELKVLIAIADHTKYAHRDKPIWRVNSDELKDINFGSIVPTWEAYQELEMFIGTILVNDNDRMVQVSEKSKLAKHGFDKWSFKNPVHRNKPRGK